MKGTRSKPSFYIELKGNEIDALNTIYREFIVSDFIRMRLYMMSLAVT